MELLKRSGLSLATERESLDHIKQAVAKVIPGQDAGAVAARIRTILRTVLRTGIDPAHLSRYGSERLSELSELMGRYSLDEPGLIYAEAGNVGSDTSRYKTFPTDDDGIVPVTDMEWFSEEAARQFEQFLQTAWGAGSLNLNLRWIAEQLSPKAGEEPIDTIRRYFSTEFYKNHIQTYKKRPIYWLFSSGKQKAFEALVYLHRYSENTLPRMRHEYVLPLMSKIEAQIETISGHADDYGHRTGGLISTSTSTSERNRLQKQLETLQKKQAELAAFDEKLRHYAVLKITIDLDDGVKVNYAKFGDRRFYKGNTPMPSSFADPAN